MASHRTLTGSLIAACVSALLLGSSASAQCQTGITELHITPDGTPGLTVNFTVRGQPFLPYVVATAQQLNWGAAPPCINLFDPSFVVLVSGLTSPFFSLNAAGESTFAIQVPTDPSFLDETYYFQAATFPPAGGMDVSNAMGLTIGMSGYACDPDTLALFRLDEGVGPTSQSQCAPMSCIVPAQVPWTAGVLGAGMQFNGMTEVVFPDPTSATTKTAGPFTVEAWVHMQPSDLPLPGGIHEIVRKNTGYCQEAFNLRLSRGLPGTPASMEFAYMLGGNCAGSGGATVGGPIENLVTEVGWYHIVGQYDGVDEMKAMFGLLGQPLQVVGTSYWGRIDPLEDFSDIHVGMGVGPPSALGFIGIIDEVRVSKVARY